MTIVEDSNFYIIVTNTNIITSPNAFYLLKETIRHVISVLRVILFFSEFHTDALGRASNSSSTVSRASLKCQRSRMSHTLIFSI